MIIHCDLNHQTQKVKQQFSLIDFTKIYVQNKKNPTIILNHSAILLRRDRRAEMNGKAGE